MIYGRTNQHQRSYANGHRVARETTRRPTRIVNDNVSEPVGMPSFLAMLRQVSQEATLGVVSGIVMGVPRLRVLFFRIVLGAMAVGAFLMALLIGLLQLMI